MLLIAVLGGMAWKPARYLKFALPWGWQNHLLHPDATHWGLAIVACFLYAGLFLMLGYRRFVKRDL